MNIGKSRGGLIGPWYSYDVLKCDEDRNRVWHLIVTLKKLGLYVRVWN